MNKKQNIHLSEIRHDDASYIDPQGFVFYYQDKIYRYIHHNAKDLFNDLLKKNIFSQLQKEINLVNTSISNINIIEKKESLILEHERIWPISYVTEWCPSMLYDAAKLTLELAIKLSDYDLILQDAHPWNVLFDGANPVFIDITSIANLDQNSIWSASEQFQESFLRPLTLSKHNKSFITRSLMQNYLQGISLEDFANAIDSSYHICHPQIKLSIWLNNKIQKHKKLKEKARELAHKSMRNITPQIRKRYLQGLLKKIGTEPKIKQFDPWKSYYEEIDEKFDKQSKIKTIRNILHQLSPKTVLDIGCNTGVFSIEAAAKSKVIAVDSSEECIEQLYQTAKKNKLSITPLIADITSPTPSFGHLNNQFPNLLTRIQSDCVLFLGIMHHIHITKRQTFDRIAQTLNKLSKKHLIFEFVSIEDDNITHLPQRRKINYNIDDIKNALSKFFNKIEEFPSDRKSRTILLCTK